MLELLKLWLGLGFIGFTGFRKFRVYVPDNRIFRRVLQGRVGFQSYGSDFDANLLLGVLFGDHYLNGKSLNYKGYALNPSTP